MTATAERRPDSGALQLSPEAATPTGHPSAWDIFTKWSRGGPWRRRLFALAVTLLVLGTVSSSVPSIGEAIEYIILKVQHPGAFDRTLSEELTSKSGVRVVERNTTLDLTGWKQTTSRDIQEGSKVSRGLSLTSFVLRKTEPGAKYFVHTVSSSSKAAPSIWCDSHSFRIVQANTQGSSGLRQWNVLVDISEEPDDAPFTVNLLVTFWNGFQKPSDWWGGFRILHSTEKAVYNVVFPPGLPAADVKFRYKDMTATETVDLDPAKLAIVLKPGNGPVRKVTWTVDNPLPDRSYQVAWTWPESASTSQ
jgi:hypothetical protein